MAALIHIITLIFNKSLIDKAIDEGNAIIANILAAPPMKQTEVIVTRAIILLYSAMKYKLKYIPLYSVLQPLTSSASASGRSNGALLVSAVIAIKNIYIIIN